MIKFQASCIKSSNKVSCEFLNKYISREWYKPFNKALVNDIKRLIKNADRRGKFCTAWANLTAKFIMYLVDVMDSNFEDKRAL